MVRVLNAFSLFVIGAAFGTLFTFGHQASLTIAGVPIPWGVALAVLGVGALLIGVRLMNRSRRPLVWVAVGVVSIVFVLSLPGPAGSVLVPNNVAGMVWSIAPTFIAVLVGFWPAPRIGRTSHAARLEPVERTAP
ncbi:MAG: hypothetical protein ACKOXM_05815 [Agromyces sp.]